LKFVTVIKRVPRRVFITGSVVLLLIVSLLLLSLRPVDNLTAVATLKSAKAQAEPLKPQMQWSPYGQQAIAVVGSPSLTNNSGKNDRFAMASIAKVVTALVLLQEKPLSLGEQGPTMTISAQDVAVYEREFAQNQSVIPVQEGEKMTEYQMLEAMLVPSATNIADSAAVWAFGSMNAYLAKANKYVASLGMKQTRLGGDASGFSPKSYSTPQDLIKLATAAMANKVVAEIVGKKSVDLPVAGTVRNFNIDLGIGGINGIKTGNTDEAGGAFLFSAPFHDRLIVGAMMGAPDLGTALHDSIQILGSFKSTLKISTVIEKGQKVGEYMTPWGETINAVASAPISILGWKNSTLPLDINLKTVSADSLKGQNVGSIQATYEGKTLASPVILEKSVPNPSLWWRIFHK
jgi:serine-type D-Ala-D-Ala carboxypeptidase (penicillin-binding protein 5/6)